MAPVHALRYDALGRRIDKQDSFGRTTFLYGDLLTGEICSFRLIEYLYEPDSYVLLAKSKSEWRNDENQLKKPQKNLCTASNPALDSLID
ncbi:MAG: hypothetical protein LBJ40_25570 [Delftia acidovorans]|nr:hypothetical protein [Delftia acidovorans]